MELDPVEIRSMVCFFYAINVTRVLRPNSTVHGNSSWCSTPLLPCEIITMAIKRGWFTRIQWEKQTYDLIFTGCGHLFDTFKTIILSMVIVFATIANTAQNLGSFSL